MLENLIPPLEKFFFVSMNSKYFPLLYKPHCSPILLMVFS